MYHRHALVRLLASLSLAAVGASCSGSDATGGTTPPAPAVGSLVLTLASRHDTITVGATRMLSASVATRDGTPRAVPVEWRSTNPAIASVVNGQVTGVAVGRTFVRASAGAAADSAEIVVAPGTVSLAVYPSAVAAALGDTIDFQVQRLGSGGASAVSTPITWRLSDTTAAQLVGDGTLATLNEGTVQLTAKVGDDEATATLKVSRAAVASVTISPSTASIVVGKTVTLTGTAYDSRGRVTGAVLEWQSSNPSVATVSSTGVVTAVAKGGVVVSATAGGKKASASINVLAAPASSVTLTLPKDTLPAGQTMQATATPYDASGAAITGRPMAWQSSNPSVATITSAGLLTGIAAGKSTISVIVDGIVTSKGLTVSASVPTSIAITPASAQLSVGMSSRLTAEVRDQHGALLSGQTVRWTSQNSGIATVSNGTVTGVSLGSTSIQATVGTLVANAAVTVQSVPVASVTVSPAEAELDVGKSVSAVVTAYDANGNVLTNRPVSFTSSAPSVATVSSQGVATGISAGRAMITATVEGKSANASLSVEGPPAAPVASVTLTLSSPSLSVGQSTQAVARTYDASGTEVTGRSITYSSLDPSVATVSSTGLVTAVGGGTVAVRATSEGQSAAASVTVSVPTSPVATVSLTAPTNSLLIPDSAQLTVTLRDASGNLLTGRTVSYGSSNPGVATVSYAGVVRAIAPGSATITATSERQSASLTFSITSPPTAPAPVASVAVTLGASTLTVGQGTQATATLRDASGAVVTGRPIAWSSSNTSVATVSQAGYVTTSGAGTATISAVSEGVSGSAPVSVQAPSSPVVTSVKVTLSATTLAVGQTTQATATARDAQGATISGKTVSWTIGSGSAVATVSSTTGTTTTVTALGAGSASVVATIDGVAGSAALNVTQPSSSPIAMPGAPALLSFRYPQVTGKSWVVSAGTNLQTVINSAQRGDEIVLQAGATFTGNFTLPAKSGTAANGWIVIRSSASGQLPAQGSRVGPAHASLMPKIVTPSVAPALATQPSASGWWISGVEFSSAPTITSMIYRIVQLGSNGTNQNTMSQVPMDLVLDRVYIHPQASQNVQRCLELNSGRTQVTDSYLYDCHAKGFDSQAILGWNGPGPFKIVNNMLAGAGENVMFGGADPSIPNLVPGDVEFRRNYVYTPASWKGVWTKKNLLETKNVERMWIEGNVFDGSWADGQTGFAFVLKVSNQSGSCTWCAVGDLTIRNNLIRNVGGGIAVMGMTSGSGNPVGQLLSRVLIENNIVENVNTGIYTGEARLVSVMNNAQDITIRRNTFSAPGSLSQFLNLATNPAATNFAWEDNVASHGTYGFFSSWFGVGENSLQGFRGTVSMKGYVMVGNSRSGYPNGSFAPDLASALSTGKGANAAAVNNAVQGVAVP